MPKGAKGAAGVNGNRPAGKAGAVRGPEGDGAPGRQGAPRARKEKEPKDPFADTSPLGLLKREAAEKLGLVEKIRAQGWGGLSAAESGRVGALVNRMLRERQGGEAGAPGGEGGAPGAAGEAEGRSRRRQPAGR